MKPLVRAIGLIALITGVAYFVPKLQPAWAAMSDSDTDFFWRASSCPHGERDPAALPLYQAVFARDAQRVALVLDHGVSPNALLHPGGWSPLMVAVAYNDHRTVELLVKRGANLNYISIDPIDCSPLVEAMSYGRLYPKDNPNFSILHYLLNAGANINIEYHNNDIASDAVTMGQISLVNEFLDRGYRHNLPRLKKLLEIVHVDEKSEAEKNKALSTIGRLLK